MAKADKKKALRASPFDDAEIEASIFGGSSAEPARKESHKSSKSTKSQQDASRRLSQQVGRVPMEKIMMRLPKALATEFQQTYLKLAAQHLETHGKKLYFQDCCQQAVRDWLAKQKERLTGAS